RRTHRAARAVRGRRGPGRGPRRRMPGEHRRHRAPHASVPRAGGQPGTGDGGVDRPPARRHADHGTLPRARQRAPRRPAGARERRRAGVLKGAVLRPGVFWSAARRAGTNMVPARAPTEHGLGTTGTHRRAPTHSPSFMPMDRLLSSCSPFLLAAVATAQAPAPSVVLPAGTEAIRRDSLLACAKHLAADAGGGRMHGTEGQVMAAEFIADRFAAAGLEPLGDPDKDGQRGWLQHYPVERTRLAEHSGFRLEDQEVREGFALLPWRGDEVTCRGALAFCGGDV